MASEEEGPQGHHPSSVRHSDHHGPHPSGMAGTREDSGPWRGRDQTKMGETYIHYLSCLGHGYIMIGQQRMNNIYF